MPLVDLFRPKWKHSDASVRLGAVKALDPSEKSTLMQVVKNDTDDAVRRAALRKIDDPDVLVDLAEEYLEGALRDLALERASSHWVNVTLEEEDTDAALAALENVIDEAALADVAKRARIDEVRMGALERLSDEKILADVARGSKENSIRLAAVTAIDDDLVLRSLALGGGSRQVAAAALDKIEDADCLETITKQAKTKSLRSRAKRKLKDLELEDAPQTHDGPTEKELERHRLAQLLLLCVEVEKHSPTSGDSSLEGKIREAQQRFAIMLAETTEDQSEIQERFDRACSSFFTELEVYQQRLSEQADQKVTLAREKKVREDIVARIDALAETAEEADLEVLEAEWAKRGPAPDDLAEAMEKQFTGACARFRKRHSSWESRREARKDFETLIEQAERDQSIEPLDKAMKVLLPIRRDWHQLADEHGVDEDLDARWQKVGEHVRQRHDEVKDAKQLEKEDNKVRLEALIADLESMKESKDWRSIGRALRDVRSEVKKPGPLPSKQTFADLRDRFRDAEKSLQDKLEAAKEAEGWNQHFADNRLIALCVSAEELSKIEEPKEVASQLRALQAEWKKVGPGSFGRRDELWTRFKKACDEAYGRCEGHFADLKKDRAENLVKKEAICEEAEALAESDDWRTTAESLKKLQNDWKAIGPVERKQSDAIWKRFRAACDKFFERRKEHYKHLDAERGENLTIKEGLCEKAEALAESNEWRETAEDLKALQAEWRSIGPVPRKVSDAIWKRFRGACDHFFARRDAHLDDGRQANLKLKFERCDELETLLAGAEDEESKKALAEKLGDMWREWPGIAPIPFDEVERTDKRFHEACCRIIETCQAELADTEFSPEATENKRKSIIAHLEKLVPGKGASDSTGDDDEAPDLAQQLKQAMAANAFRKEAQTQEKARVQEQAERALKNWRALPPTPSDAASELEQQFKKVFEKVAGRPLQDNKKKKAPRRPQKTREADKPEAQDSAQDSAQEPAQKSAAAEPIEEPTKTPPPSRPSLAEAESDFGAFDLFDEPLAADTKNEETAVESSSAEVSDESAGESAPESGATEIDESAEPEETEEPRVAGGDNEEGESPATSETVDEAPPQDTETPPETDSERTDS